MITPQGVMWQKRRCMHAFSQYCCGGRASCETPHACMYDMYAPQDFSSHAVARKLQTLVTEVQVRLEAKLAAESQAAKLAAGAAKPAAQQNTTAGR